MIEYYTSALGHDLAMFTKYQVKPILSDTYEEAERVEAEKESIEDYPKQSGEKTSGKRALLLSKPKEEQSHDFKGMLKMIKKLSNRIIDLEKEREVQKTEPHSEKNYPQWLNSMTMVMNQLLDSKLTKDSKEEEKNNKTIEKQEDDTMFLWDCVSLFDTEESTLKPKNIPRATKDMDLIIKDNATISKIKKLQKNVKRQMNAEDKTPEVTTVNQETE